MKHVFYLLIVLLSLGVFWIDLPSNNECPFGKSYRTELKFISIDFSKINYPDEIQNVVNVSGHESWGRWTDGSPAIFTFKSSLPKRMQVVILCGSFRMLPNTALKIEIGNSIKYIPLNSCEKEYHSVLIDNPSGESVLRITPPCIVSPASEGLPNDNRNLGLSLFKLEITDVL